MLTILIPIALLFFVLELVRPARPQPVLRRRPLADTVYVRLHFSGPTKTSLRARPRDASMPNAAGSLRPTRAVPKTQSKTERLFP